MIDKAIKERREKALAAIKDIKWKIEPVEHDDYGDSQYKYHITYWLKGYCLWDDWLKSEPDESQVHNMIAEAIVDGKYSELFVDFLEEMEILEETE